MSKKELHFEGVSSFRSYLKSTKVSSRVVTSILHIIGYQSITHETYLPNNLQLLRNFITRPSINNFPVPQIPTLGTFSTSQISSDLISSTHYIILPPKQPYMSCSSLSSPPPHPPPRQRQSTDNPPSPRSNDKGMPARAAVQ